MHQVNLDFLIKASMSLPAALASTLGIGTR
jgi:hypothetical protein